MAGAIPILVDITADDPPVRVNISLGEQLLQRLDAAAEAGVMTRSGFIAQAVRVSLGERAGHRREFEATGQRMQDELSATGRKINESLSPDSAFGRRMAEVDVQITTASAGRQTVSRLPCHAAAGQKVPPSLTQLNPPAIRRSSRGAQQLTPGHGFSAKSRSELQAIRESVAWSAARLTASSRPAR